MPVYEYTAINPQGKNVKGRVDADSIRGARQKLRSQSIFPTDIKEGSEAAASKSGDVRRYFQSDKISLKNLAVATRQLATLVGAGLPLVSALQALSEQTDSEVLQRIVINVRENVEEGSTLHKALESYPKSFPRLYINMVAAGEASGSLDVVLNNLADYLESQLELRQKIRSALTYPVLMMIVCGGVIMGLFVFVVPKIVEIFVKQNAVLPLPTRVMMALSDFFIAYWYVIVLLVLLTPIAIRWYYKQPKGREQLDRLLLKLPIFGRIYQKIYTARVAMTLSTLLSSGVQLLPALDIAQRLSGNIHVERALGEARDGVREGRGFAKELTKSGLFPSMLSHMIAVGEKSGELESMLTKAGQAYEKEVNATLEGLTALLEPLLMIVVGVIVLCIVLSVLLPMVDLIDVVGGPE